MRAPLWFFAAVSLSLVHSAGTAQDTAEEAAVVPPPRDAIRPRVGVAFGATAVVSQATYDVWDMSVTCELTCTTPTGWILTGQWSQQVTGVAGSISFQLGVQSDFVAGFVFSRVSAGLGVLPHFSSGLAVEVTLGDFFQLSIGPSIDLIGRTEMDLGYERGMQVGNRRQDRYVGPGPSTDRGNPTFDWTVAPGADIRVGFASGGGPFERRGFAFVPYVHISVPSNGLLVLAGLEVGWQSF